MSIDLATKIDDAVNLRVVLPDIALVLRDLLGVNVSPRLVLDVLKDGKRSPAVTDELRDRTTPFFLIALEGEPETVGLWTDGQHVSITMAAQRTKLEYAVGAAVAITMARRFGGTIEDDRGFFGPKGEVSADQMFQHLRVQLDSRGNDLRKRAESLCLGDERRASTEI